ncbi:MAG TPA: hypothetical protein VNI58_08020 [Mariprofundaceae bacterium]|nr:hypothetical protein [Mariprofundaceae bacterium]
MLALTIPREAPAVPAFSRQIHADCRTCHFQNMRSLNRYGREFKQNGFTETNEMRELRLQRRQKAARPGKDGN